MSFAYGYESTYVSATSFTVSGDKTDTFHAGRRIRANCGADGLKYGTVNTSSYSTPTTTITLKTGSDALTSNLEVMQVALVDIGDTGTIPYHDHSDLGQGGDVVIPADVNITEGHDITMTASDTDPGELIFEGSTNSVTVSGSEEGKNLSFLPDSNNVCYFRAGNNNFGSPEFFKYVDLHSSEHVSLYAWYNSSYYSRIHVYNNDTTECSILMRLAFSGFPSSDYGLKYLINSSGDLYFSPDSHKSVDLAQNATAFDDAYADDWNNVADFFLLDSIDDLGAIHQIKGNGKIDERTGLELIDDNTLPEWLLTKHKRTKEILYDPDGKPYISLKTFCSLLSGAIKQLDEKFEDHMREHHGSS